MTCFVAGTMILTVTGLVAIENIKAGDFVVSTNPDTMETAEKRVVETYIREDSKLIHIAVNGEEIITTETHPFYVNKRGFVEAGNLKIGDTLYYGSMSDPYVVRIKVKTKKKVDDLEIADKVSIQLMSTSPEVNPRKQVVKSSEKTGLYSAMDFAEVWLRRALKEQ